jgi:hypothetical protein
MRWTTEWAIRGRPYRARRHGQACGDGWRECNVRVSQSEATSRGVLVFVLRQHRLWWHKARVAQGQSCHVMRP